MKKLLEWIRGQLFRLRRRRLRWKTDSITFPRFDVEQLSREMRIEEKAAGNGEHELPPSDAKHLDGVEQGIVARLQGDIREIRGHTNITYSGLCRRIAEIDIARLLNPLSTIARRFDQQLSILEAEKSAEVTRARSSFRALEDEYRRFRVERGIDREPDYPDSRLYLWGLLTFSVVAEGLMNALFFERGSERGFVGGAGMALMLAFIDVLIVFWFGRFGAWAKSRRLWEILIGTVASLAALGWVGGYNLLVSHIREQLQATVEIREAAQLALDSFLHSPFGLTQADSWMLFAVGTVFSLMAFFSGYSWDDPIRGYGRLDRRLRDSEEELNYHTQRLFEDARELRDAFHHDLDERLREARSDFVALENAIRTKRTLVTNLEGFRQHCGDTLHALIQIYRTENRKARKTAPPPYFNRRVTEDLVEPFADNESDDAVQLNQQRKMLKAAEAASSESRDTIDETYRAFLTRAQDLTGSTPELEPRLPGQD